MMNQKDIRWKERFVNFNKAYLQLEAAIQRFDELDNLSKEGLVQRFEYTFELAWKTMKDFLESKGVEENFPRDIIKMAFQSGILDNGEVWMDMLKKRNLMAHTYNEPVFQEVLFEIKNHFFPQIQKLIHFFLKQNG